MTQLPPGRELSRLVAEAIGELRSSHPGFYWQEFATEDGDGGDGFSCPRCGKSVSDPDESTKGDCYKSYSTHIEDAMELVERFRLVVRPSVLSDKWVVGKFERVYLDGKVEVSNEATGVTIPHAISLAVIEAAKEMKKK